MRVVVLNESLDESIVLRGTFNCTQHGGVILEVQQVLSALDRADPVGDHDDCHLVLGFLSDLVDCALHLLL